MKIQSEYVWPIGVGVTAFVATRGFEILEPSSLGWLANGDSPTQQLGWEFFRTQQWTWPLGLIPAYGMELGGSLVYSDSIPLMAIPAKLLSPQLPSSFQYFGLWLLICFILQSIFAWQLLALITQSRAILFTGTAFFATAPVLLWRMSPPVSQWSLSGQFTILAGFWLTLRPESRNHVRNWSLLLAATTAIHAYLLLMVSALWAADLLQRRPKFPTAKSRHHALLIPPAVVILVAWMCGYFTIAHGAGGAGFGIFKASPIALIDPGNPSAGFWSRLIPDLPGDWIHIESFNFLGIGVLGLLLDAMSKRTTYSMVSRALRRWPWTAVAIVSLALFSLSNDWGGHYRYLHWPMPSALDDVVAVFRSSGRMLWPTTYALTALSIVLAVRSHRKRSAVMLISACLVLQLLDTSTGWPRNNGAFSSSASGFYIQPLEGDFWTSASKRYTEIRALPIENQPRGWPRVAKFAADHGLSTDVVNLARFNAAALKHRRSQLTTYVAEGCYPSNAMFLVQSGMKEQVRRNLDVSRDLLTEVDGLLVLAPGWLKKGSCNA